MVRGRRRSTATTEKAVTYESFAWNELYTRDVEAAKAFYAATVGWTFEGGPMPHVDRCVAEVDHGGRIVRPPFDVANFGRIAIGADATEAFLAWVTTKR